MKTCMNCKYASWNRTAAGRLHPDGSGRCMWEFPQIPKSMHWFGTSKPAGGYIDRKNPNRYADCPTWEEKAGDLK